MIKLSGLLLLAAGWLLVLAAMALLTAPLARSIFVAAGIAVEILGLTLLVRAHRIAPEEDK